MIGRLNHVAIAVPDLMEATLFYKNVLMAEVSPPLPLPEHGVTTVFVNLLNSKIELLSILGENSPIMSFLQKNPTGGIHHVCYEVKNLSKAIENLHQKGYRILGEGVPKIGAHGLPVIFLHPKETFGTLIGLEEV